MVKLELNTIINVYVSLSGRGKLTFWKVIKLRIMGKDALLAYVNKQIHEGVKQTHASLQKQFHEKMDEITGEHTIQ